MVWSFYEESIWYDRHKIVGISQTHVAECVWYLLGNVMSSEEQGVKFLTTTHFPINSKKCKVTFIYDIFKTTMAYMIYCQCCWIVVLPFRA